MLRLPAALKEVRKASYKGARTYQARPYEGELVLFRATEKGLSGINQESAWKRLAPTIEIVEVSGHHGNMVDAPQVHLLASEMKARLETAYRKQDEESAMQSATLLVTSNSEGRLESA